jgi:hypothetical protein
MEIDRLVKPDATIQDYFPKFSWNTSHVLKVSEDPILLVDPTYLAWVFHDEDENASYLRKNGVFLFDFGGDWFGPLWQWKSFLIMATSHHYEVYPDPPNGAKTICRSIGCDSATFVLLPVTDKVPESLKQKIDECLKQNNAVLLKMAKGRWEFKFEQFDSPEKDSIHLCRNIILQHKPSSHSRTSSCSDINPYVTSSSCNDLILEIVFKRPPKLRVRKKYRPRM